MNNRRKPGVDNFHNGGGPLKVPGFGLGVNYGLDTWKHQHFRHGMNDFHNDRLLVREIAMLNLMDAITDKPRWQEKVFDETIVEKWRAEATAMPLISQLTWEWCLRELREKTAFLAEHGFITTLETGSACGKADGLIDDDLRNELLAGVKPLLNVKESAKDWHPNSNDQVLNLVHPSLFPFVYGRTHVLQEGLVGLSDCVESCGKGTVVQEATIEPPHGPYGRDEYEKNKKRFSMRFQWLPAEVRFNGEGFGVSFASYINNLHPKHHEGLYSTISKVLSKAIPMWNEVLVKEHYGRVPPRVKTWYDNPFRHRLDIHATEPKIEPEDPPAWHAEAPYGEDHGPPNRDSTWVAKVNEYIALPDHPEFNASADDSSDQAFKDGTWVHDHMVEMMHALDWKFKRTRGVVHPEPGEDYSYDEWKAGLSAKKRSNDYGGQTELLRHEYYKVNLEQEFRDRGLQVIVRLASVELTPEKPEYSGGNWHLEGMMNEHIVATAIYYYDVDNISESLLDFRMEATLDDDEISYEQDDHEPLARVFGTDSMRDEPAVQNLGSVKCKPGRMLAFPNTLQHRVQPFGLEDPTRAGHRRFLVLWLVDPNYRVISTANVPPQQHDWLAPETIDKVLANRDLAAELQDMIKEHANDYPMSLETAKELRLELMQERTKLMPSVEQGFEQYNLCEH